MTITATTVELTTLLSSPTLTLIYAVPLLIVSILLTFAGTFLLLDRTSSFSPRHGRSDKYVYSPHETFETQKPRECCWWWRLQGGVGGLAVGYIFGVQLSTFLAMLVPHISTSAPLSSITFLIVCILSGIVCAVISGRFKIAAILLAGLSSGALTSLVFSIMLHPPLLGRWVLFAIFTLLVALPTTIIGTISTFTRPTTSQDNGCSALLPHLTHPFLRFCTASTGAFGILFSTALLLKPPIYAWANIWERLWVSDGQGWGSSKEKGLIAAWFFFTALGILDDWALRYWLGDNPDEAWDDYLSSFVQALPYSSNRAGTFKPLPSFWDRFFHRHTKPSKPVFPGSFDTDPRSSEADVKLKPLLADDLSSHHSPIPESAIPEPFYAQTPPPPSLLRAKSKSAAPYVSPLSDSEPDDGGKSTDDSEDYTLPPFVKKRRKKSKVRLRLYNPDSTTKSRAAAPKSVGFRTLPLAGKDPNVISDVEKGKPWVSPFDDGSISSATLVESEGRPASHNSGSERSNQGKRPERKRTKDVENTPGPDYSDHEVDLTSLATSLDAKQREGKESRKLGVPKFMERHMSPPLPVSPVTQATAVKFTPANLPRTTTTASPVLETTGVVMDASASDRARERVRAFVASSPVRRHSSQASLTQLQLQLAQKRPTPAEGTPEAPPRSPISVPLSTLPLPAAVPATPSLINALQRVALAQQQAFGPVTTVQDIKTSPKHAGHAGPTTSPDVGGKNMRGRHGDPTGVWDDFWRDVRAKARSPER